MTRALLPHVESKWLPAKTLYVSGTTIIALSDLRCNQLPHGANDGARKRNHDSGAYQFETPNPLDVFEAD
jgi:hypothetical protein